MELRPPHYSHWRNAATPSFSTQQKYWLSRPGALTTGLRGLGPLELRVVREYAHGLLPCDAWMVAGVPRSPIWVREIIMSIDGVDSVFARSFTPLNASHGLWQGMRRLRTRPLADMLYNDPQIARSRFFSCRLTNQIPLYHCARNMLGAHCPPAHAMLARCSTFWRRGQPLLVAECFLPEFWPVAQRL